MITAYATKDHLGSFALKKIAGEVGNGNPLNTQVNIPYTECTVVEAMNNTYSGVANVSAGAVNATRGKTEVIILAMAPAHPGWFTALNINDWLGGAAGFLQSGNLDTSQWDIDRYEPVLGDQRYTGGKMQGMGIVYNANGGPIAVALSMRALYAAEDGSPATFTTPTRLTGRDYDTSDVTSSSLDLLRSFTLNLARAQAQQNVGDGTHNGIAITSHAIGGTLSIEQIPTAVQGKQVAAGVNVLNGTIVLQIGPASTGVKFTTYVNRDTHRRTSPGNAPGSDFFDYSLADIANTGGTGYPFIVAAGS